MSIQEQSAAYMQMLFKHTEPFEFRPYSVLSCSSFQFGGPAHWSVQARQGVVHGGAAEASLTVSVKLARAAHREHGQALVLLVGAEEAGVAAQGDVREGLFGRVRDRAAAYVYMYINTRTHI